MGATATEAALPAKRLKPSVCASRSSARYAVVSKRRDRCLSGSSALESPEKVRGIEETNDSFKIEFEDYELQQEEMEEMEQGFTYTSCMSKNYATAYPCCVCCGSKFHEMNIYA
jgi:hypothetical protein